MYIAVTRQWVFSKYFVKLAISKTTYVILKDYDAFTMMQHGTKKSSLEMASEPLLLDRRFKLVVREKIFFVVCDKLSRIRIAKLRRLIIFN